MLFFPMNLWSSGQPKNDAKTLFCHPPSPFPGNFCNCNSADICTASQLYTVWSNALLRNRPESDTATSCAKDYKGHSLVQTSFTELPNRFSCLQFFFFFNAVKWEKPNQTYTLKGGGGGGKCGILQHLASMMLNSLNNNKTLSALNFYPFHQHFPFCLLDSHQLTGFQLPFSIYVIVINTHSFSPVSAAE